MDTFGNKIYHHVALALGFQNLYSQCKSDISTAHCIDFSNFNPIFSTDPFSDKSIYFTLSSIIHSIFPWSWWLIQTPFIDLVTPSAIADIDIGYVVRNRAFSFAKNNAKVGPDRGDKMIKCAISHYMSNLNICHCGSFIFKTRVTHRPILRVRLFFVHDISSLSTSPDLNICYGDH
jgi:hypothetical protein